MENDRLLMQYSQDYSMKPMVKVFSGLNFFYYFCLYKSLFVFYLLTLYGFSTNTSSSEGKIFPGCEFSGLLYCVELDKDVPLDLIENS